MDTSLSSILILLIFVLLGLLLFLLFLQLRKPQGSMDLSTSLQNLTQAIQQEQTQTTVLSEKISHLEPVVNATSNIQLELRSLKERVTTIEQNQQVTDQGIRTLATGLAQTSAANDNLLEATSAIRDALSQAKNDLTELQTLAKLQQTFEQKTSESIRRLEAIIAGTQTKGVAGENILEAVFAKLPPEWQVRNFRVGNKQVEFGLRLPNNLILPIDSKWPGTNLLEQFLNSDNTEEQQRLKAQLEAIVLEKAKEVKKYLDPHLTVNFGIAAVPDAVYDLCSGIQPDIFQHNIMLISYSMFIPYLLLVYQTILKTAQNINLEKLSAYLQTAQNSIKALQEELEGRLPRAITMLNNSRNEMSMHVSKISSGLTNLQIRSGTPGDCS